MTLRSRQIRGRISERGMSYVELGVVLLLLTLAAAAIVPNLVRMERQRETRRFKAELAALVGDTRSLAMEGGDTVALTYDKTARSFKAVVEGRNASTSVLRTLAAPDGVETSRFATDRYESPGDGWRLPFFFDGTTTGGGVEMKVDGSTWSLTVAAGDGRIRTIDGEMPDMADDTWKAEGHAKS